MSVRQSPTPAGDHGALDGRTDDDHLLYDLADGSRATTGDKVFNGKVTVNDAIECSTTTGWWGLPNMTTTQRDALTSPPNGACVWNTTAGQAQVYTGTGWAVLGGSS